MSETAAPAPAAPSTAPSAPTNGASAPQTPAPAAGQTRDPATGRFVQANGQPAEAPAPETGPTLPPELLGRLGKVVGPDGMVSLKLHGREQRLPLEAALQRLQIDMAGQSRFEEAARLQKDHEAKLARLKDPETFWEAATELGLSEEQAITLSERMLSRHLERLQPRSPEQIQLEQERQRRVKAEREAQEIKQRQEQDTEQREMQLIQKQWTEWLPPALKDAGLPDAGRAGAVILGRLNPHLQEALGAGQMVTPDIMRYAAHAAKHELRDEHQALTGGLEGQALVEWLGEDVVRKVRRHDYEQHMAKRQQGQSPKPPAAPQQAQEEEKHYTSPGELRALFRKGM